MMGACDDEVKEVSQSSSRSDSRILGFDEEEKRLKQRMWNSQQASLKLPQGAYIFCDFRTLNLPGIELNPPPSEALRRMHMLACDPGIIAIMNKHRWRVGIMTEMAPEGYVGISPKCILGFNKNKGEEISLRLRTDDLKGFRKYESIKKTLLHELAHMVYSEHDADFHALDKQLNQEANSLDWTKSKSHTLSGRKITDYNEEAELNLGGSSSYTGQKLGGASKSFASARISSMAAAYKRIFNSSTEEPTPFNNSQLSDAAIEPGPDDGELNEVEQKITAEPDPDDMLMIEKYAKSSIEALAKPNAIDYASMRVDTSSRNVAEPNPDESLCAKTTMIKNVVEPDPDDSSEILSSSNSLEADGVIKAEPDPDDQRDGMNSGMLRRIQEAAEADEVMIAEPDPDDQGEGMDIEELQSIQGPVEADEVMKAEPDPDDGMNSEVLQRIEEPVAALCSRIQRAIKMLRSEATPAEASSALQTLFKIIRNVIEHPEEMKFRKLRKSNPQIQRNVVNYKAAMEVLTMIGFGEDDVSDEVGRKETYLVLKRNDPGLLWLAKSSLEVSMG